MARRRRSRRERNALFNLYAGGTMTSGQASGAGGALASISAGHARHRAQILKSNVESGAMSLSSLSPTDRLLVAQQDPTKDSGGGAKMFGIDLPFGLGDKRKGVLGFLRNALGDQGLEGALKHLPGGIWEMGKSGVEDIAEEPWKLASLAAGPLAPLAFGGISIADKDSKTYQNIVKPTWETYKWQYGPLTKGDFKTTGKRFYEQPLPYLLDVGTVASGGAGGVAKLAQLSGNTGRLSRMTSREGRPDKEITSGLPNEILRNRGAEPIALPRYYSNRPLRKLWQVGADAVVRSRLGEVGGRASLQRISERRSMGDWIDKNWGLKQMAGQQQIMLKTRDLAKLLNGLSPGEVMALHLALRGANTRPRLNALQESWRASLRGENEEGRNVTDFSPDVSHEYLEYKANLPESVVQLIEEPTERMIRAADRWNEVVEAARADLGVPDDVHLDSSFRLQRELAGGTDADGVTPVDTPTLLSEFEESGYPIRPTYVPDVDAAQEGLTFRKTGSRIPGIEGARELASRVGLGDRRGGREPELIQGKRARVGRLALGPENVVREPFQAYLKHSDLNTLMSGVVRFDKRVLLNHIARREQDLVDDIFNHTVIRGLALTDRDGEEVQFKRQSDVDKEYGHGRYVLVHPDMATRFFRQETQMLEKVIDKIDELRQSGRDVGDDEMLAALNDLLKTDAREFVTSTMGAVRNYGVAIPRAAYDRLAAHAKATEPFNFGPARAYQTALNKWRTWTLAMMPRWWINTAVGTATLNMVKGVWNPRDYYRAWKLRGSANLDPRVRLGGLAIAESLENNRVASSLGGTRWAFDTVQKIEDYFRTASYMHSLKKVDREHMNEIGEIVKSYAPFMDLKLVGGKEGRLGNEEAWLAKMTENPEYVRWAIDDVNRFAYNFMDLGPTERRYVRQFIPFWGWYKFITKLIWRLPMDHPGKMNAVVRLGQIGQMKEEELGWLPPWARGAIFLNTDKRNLRYLPTRGLNPFSSFANPFSVDGTIAGLMRLGQLSPAIGAGLYGMGIDPQTGDRVSISPQEGIGSDFFGGWVDTATGEPIHPMQAAGGRRFGMGLARAFPQFRIAEPLLMGGNPPYPESVPLFAPRPMGVLPESRREFDVGFQPSLNLLAPYSGLAPKTIDLKRSQGLREKRAEYAETKNKNERKKLRKRLRKEE